MKKLFLFILLVNLVYLVNSQPSKRELIRGMLPKDVIVKSIVDSTINNSSILLNPNASNDKPNSEINKRFLNMGKEELADSLINIYDSLFSYEEIQQLSKFYKSDEGLRFNEYLLLIILRAMQAGSDRYELNHHIPRFMLDSVNSSTDTSTKQVFLYKEVDFQPDKPFKYKKSRSSRSVCTSVEFGYKVYYNDKIWKEIDPAILNSSADRAFKMKDDEVYGLIMAERNDLNLKDLRYTAVFNLYDGSESYEILHDGLRYTNGNEVLSMKFIARINAADIKYHNYYYTDNSMVIQFSTFCKSEAYEKYKSGMETLLNGLVIIK